MRAAAGCVALAAALAPGPALAQGDTNQPAREAFERGVALMQEERWEDALPELEMSLQLYPTQVALYDVAQCLRHLGRGVEALEALKRFLREFGAQAPEERRRQVVHEIETLGGSVGRLRVSATEGAVISLEGHEAGVSPLPGPLVLPSGEIEVSARKRGHHDVLRIARVEPGRTTSLRIEMVLAHDPGLPIGPTAQSGRTTSLRIEMVPSRSSSRRPPPPLRSGLSPGWFWSATVVTGAAAIATAILGTLALAGDADYRANTMRTAEDQEAGRRLVIATDVSLGVAVAAALVAVILYPSTDFASVD